MTEVEQHSPGTVSKILWHFTGGPKWNSKTKKQNIAPRPAAEAHNNLKSIFRSREIQLGNYKELVKVILPEHRRYDTKSKKWEIKKDFPVEIESSPICCLSDIPAPHLRYHAQRYGKFALGFHRSAVINAGFNPVFYTLEDTPIIRSIYEGFSSLRFADPAQIENAAEDLEYELDSFLSEHDSDGVDLSGEISDIQSEASYLISAVEDAKHSLQDFVAFIKTFDRSEFGTIYCEREWRSTSPFSFDLSDLAMIVLPKRVSKSRYFEPFAEKVAPKIGLPRRIPIIPWEDLVEH
jgi:hypothetical protein